MQKTYIKLVNLMKITLDKYILDIHFFFALLYYTCSSEQKIW